MPKIRWYSNPIASMSKGLWETFPVNILTVCIFFFINLGDTVPDVDRCFRCTCTNNNGQLNCVSICEYGDCYGKWVEPKGDECCDTCEPIPGCMYNGTEYGIGEFKIISFILATYQMNLCTQNRHQITWIVLL